MNIEFLLLVIDYFRTIKIRDFVLEWILPLLIGIAIYFSNTSNCNVEELFKSVSGNVTSLLGVLIGFSVAVITILVTTNSKNIDEIKAKETEYKISNKKLTLFDLMLINYTYSVVIEVLLTVFNLTAPNLLRLSLSNNSMNLLNSVDVFLTCHVLLLILRNITNFYFILIKK